MNCSSPGFCALHYLPEFAQSPVLDWKFNEKRKKNNTVALGILHPLVPKCICSGIILKKNNFFTILDSVSTKLILSLYLSLVLSIRFKVLTFLGGHIISL